MGDIEAIPLFEPLPAGCMVAGRNLVGSRSDFPPDDEQVAY